MDSLRKLLAAGVMLSFCAPSFGQNAQVPPVQTLMGPPSSIQLDCSGQNNFVYNLAPGSQFATGKFVLFMGFPLPTGNPAVLNGPGGTCPASSGSSMGDYTGFYPSNPSASQLEEDAAWPGSTGVQGAVDNSGTVTSGIIIHSDSAIAKPAPQGTTLLPITADYGWSNPPYVWGSDLSSGVIYNITVEIPTAAANDTQTSSPPWSAAYADGYFSVQDNVTGLTFWMGASFYDHRGNASASDIILWDGTTAQPIVNSVVTAPGVLIPGQGFYKYATPVLGSAGFQAATWNSAKQFSFAINGYNLQQAINDLRSNGTVLSHNASYANLSQTVSNYKILSTNFNPEVAYNGSFGMIATAFNKYSIVQNSSIPLPLLTLFNTTANRYFYTTSQAEAQNAISSGQWVLQGAAGQLYTSSIYSSILQPLYRLFRTSDSDHFYTTSLAEAQSAITNGGYVSDGNSYVTNGIAAAGYLPIAANPLLCSMKLYRYYTTSQGHYYTPTPNGGSYEAVYCIAP